MVILAQIIHYETKIENFTNLLNQIDILDENKRKF